METKITKKRNHPLDNSSLVEQLLEITNGFILGFKAVLDFASILPFVFDNIDITRQNNRT